MSVVREIPEPVFVRSPGIDSQPGRIDFLKSIPGLLKRLQIRALDYFTMFIDKQKGIERPRLKSSFSERKWMPDAEECCVGGSPRWWLKKASPPPPQLSSQLPFPAVFPAYTLCNDDFCLGLPSPPCMDKIRNAYSYFQSLPRKRRSL